MFGPQYTSAQLAEQRKRNNPANAPTGDFTGRCRHCGSSDLWDDNLAYGCNNCHALLNGNGASVMMVKDGMR